MSRSADLGERLSFISELALFQKKKITEHVVIKFAFYSRSELAFHRIIEPRFLIRNQTASRKISNIKVLVDVKH